jgi:TonB family protein
MPGDSRELILLAAQANDIIGEDSKPWHLKATFKSVDEQGKMTDEGTYEEFWVRPDKFKRTFAGSGYTQTDIGTANGVLRSGQQKDVAHELMNIRREFVAPLPNERSLGNGSFTEKGIKLADGNLRCVTLPGPAGTPSYCIGSDAPMLRISFWPVDGAQFLRNRILRFQGHYVPGDLSLVRAGRIVLSAHLDTIEAFDPEIEAEFVSSSDAVLLPRRVNISAGVAVGLLEHKEAPEYPYEARAQRITGTVVMQALIGVDGHIKELSVVSGPSVLQKPALDAVRTWRYRPYLLNGSPVEVMTTINVIFTLGG